MKLTTHIARRFMLGGRGASRFTGWIAIIGMAVGCFALVLSLAVLNGFEGRVTEKIIGFEGDLRITRRTSTETFTKVINILREKESIANVMPFMERKGILLNSGAETRMVTFKAVDFNSLFSFYELGIKEENYDARETPIVIGRLLANRLNLGVGDEIKLMSPIDNPVRFGIPRQFKGTIAAIFQVDVLDYDDRLAFIPLELGWKLFLRKQGLDGIDLRLSNPDELEDIQKELEDLLSKDALIETWQDLHKGLFQAMKMERLGAIIVLSLIILVASFNLTSTLVLVTYQKIREIGILRTLGASAGTIRSILLRQGIMIGAAGALVGLILSLLIVLIQTRFGVLPLPKDIYFMDRLPMILKPMDIIVVPLIAFILIILSSTLAARRAVMIKPKEAVHLEK